MSIEEKIRTFITKNMIVYDDKQSVKIKDDDNIFTKGFVNSLFAMRMVVFIEEEYAISINNNDLDIKNFSTVENIASFIQNKIS